MEEGRPDSPFPPRSLLLWPSIPYALQNNLRCPGPPHRNPPGMKWSLFPMAKGLTTSFQPDCSVNITDSHKLMRACFQNMLSWPFSLRSLAKDPKPASLPNLLIYDPLWPQIPARIWNSFNSASLANSPLPHPGFSGIMALLLDLASSYQCSIILHRENEGFIQDWSLQNSLWPWVLS